MRWASISGLWFGRHETPVPSFIRRVIAERLGDEEVGARDVLPLRGDVLADPRLLVAELVEEDELLEVVGHRPAGIGARRVERHREVADAHRGLPVVTRAGSGRPARDRG